MTIDKEKLKALAQSVADLEDHPELEAEHAEAKDALWQHMHCHTILTLLAEIERLATTRSMKERHLEQELEVWRHGPSCWSCGDTGDVHDITGEWRGECDCLAAQLINANRERDQLKAENEDYKSGQERYEQIIEDLKAENEALRKDAERYQWLRQGMGKVIVVEPDNDAPCDCDGYEVLLESEVDDAVDADIAKEAIHD